VRAFEIGRICIAGDHKNRRRGRDAVLAQEPAQIESVHARKARLHDDDPRAKGQGFRERLTPVRGLLDTPCRGAQELGVHVSRVVVAIDEEGEHRMEPAGSDDRARG
jgi:hypothetical protein